MEFKGLKVFLRKFDCYCKFRVEGNLLVAYAIYDEKESIQAKLILEVRE